MNKPLREAIEQFALLPWLEARVRHLTVGAEHVRMDCPHCHGKRSLSVNRYTKACQCFRCSEGRRGGARWTGVGGLIDLISLVEGVDRRSAAEEILKTAPWAGCGLAMGRPLVAQEAAPRLPEPIMALRDVPASHPARVKLRDRELEHMVSWAYLALERPYVNRWIFPVWWDGRFVGWEAKSFVGASPPTRLPDWFQAGSMVYTTVGWDRRADYCVITESIVDAETIGMNAVGLFGSVLRDGQCNRLFDLRARGVSRLVWFLDEDAWTKQRRSILRKTLLLFANYVVHPPEGSDPNDLRRAKCRELIRRASLVTSSFDLLRN